MIFNLLNNYWISSLNPAPGFAFAFIHHNNYNKICIRHKSAKYKTINFYDT